MATTLTVLVAVGSSQTVENIYSFTAASNKHGLADPAYVTLTQGHDGRLYGTATGITSSISSAGAVFRFSPNFPSNTMKAIHVFQGSDGSSPYGSVTLATDGNLYGIAAGGSFLSGVLFKLSTKGTYTLLQEFGLQGAYPAGAPIETRDGGLYGATEFNTSLATGYGTVYRYSSSVGFSTIYNFDLTLGAFPGSPPIQGSDGNLYGTTIEGGAFNCGTIYKLTTTGTLLHSYSFAGGTNGACYPVGPLMQATDGCAPQ